jgi:hypothetical protein
VGSDALSEVGDHIALGVLVGAGPEGEVPGSDGSGDDDYDED